MSRWVFPFMVSISRSFLSNLWLSFYLEAELRFRVHQSKQYFAYLVYRAPTNKLTNVEDTTSWCFMQTWLVHYLFLLWTAPLEHANVWKADFARANWGCLLKRLINLGRPASLKNYNMYVFSSRLRWSHVLGNEIVFYNRISTMFVCLKENHGKNSGSELQNFSVNDNAKSFAALGDKRHATFWGCC